jgi:predicted Rossmann fold nucleotide-binding protein DprA/Smf involved in DNA uptake
MSEALSPNTKAILLLTAPLIAGRGKTSPDFLTPAEYRKLARHLRDLGRQPADLLTPGADQLLGNCHRVIDKARLERLLARGLLLSQAVERWQARAIWVVSRADREYPRRLKTRLTEDSPALLYGCGEKEILDSGGLAVVGSRNVDDALIEYTQEIGRLAASASRTLVSGGARGIDQAAMRGALEARGRVTGVLADSLERSAMNREYRNLLLDGQLVLISPYDPNAGFNVGHAMQRNKVIYALSDAALIVNAESGKGGTWAGAVEQLDKLRLVPIYIRSNGEIGEGLQALHRKGAQEWPNPRTPDQLSAVLDASASSASQGVRGSQQASLFSQFEEASEPYGADAAQGDAFSGECHGAVEATPAEDLFAKVRELLQGMDTPKTDSEVAKELAVSKSQAKAWLQRLVAEGAVERLSRPIRYRSVIHHGNRCHD